MNEPSIYVVCIAAHSNGHTHGVWIDATQDPQDLHNQIGEMLANSPLEGAEAWAIHDQNNFAGLPIAEDLNMEEVHALAVFIKEHGDAGAAALDLFDDLEEAETALEDGYLGDWESAADYARALLEDTGSIPRWLELYVNYDAMAHDMELNGEISTILGRDRRIHIFSY